MSRKKITIVGAGNVGAAVAKEISMKGFADITLLDIERDKAKGKALDLMHSLAMSNSSCDITGTADFESTENSDIVIVTSGVGRISGMTRDELFDKNKEIMISVSENIKKYSPDSTVIIVSNPLNAMVAVANSVLNFPSNRIMGMAGELDSARFIYYISQQLDVCMDDIDVTILGDHGDSMLPLPRYSSVGGIALTQLLDEKSISKIVENTRYTGGKLIELLGHSAYFAAGAAVCKMVEAIILDQKKIVTCCAWCEEEYDLNGKFAGVPVVLGSGGIERVIELKLDRSEEEAFRQSVEHTSSILQNYKTGAPKAAAAQS